MAGDLNVNTMIRSRGWAQHGGIPRFWEQIVMEDDQADYERSYSNSALVSPGGFALSDYENSEALAHNLKTQFQPLIDPSVRAVIEIFDVALRSHFLSPTSEPQLTNPDDFH